MNSPIESPKTLKTVSEFRKKRSSEFGKTPVMENADSYDHKSFRAANSSETLPDFLIDSQAVIDRSGITVPMLPLQAERVVVYDAESGGDGDAIRSALEYFDIESSAPFLPSSFVANHAPNSAIAEFMSRAVDLEAAFQFAGEIAPVPEAEALQCKNKAEARQDLAKTLDVDLPASVKAELIEDDGNGLVEAVASSQVVDTQEMPLPDEPGIASCRLLDQASVLKDPQDDSSITISIEKNEFGQVSRALYYGGESVNFKYDHAGNLSEFNYAGISWKPENEGWGARDRQTEYFVDGRISVLDNGCILIEREDMTRILKLSGTRIDEHKSGSRTESRKLKNKPSPYDLLAKAKPVNSIWLTSKSLKNSGEQTRIPSRPLSLDLVAPTDAGASELNSDSAESKMIPPIAKAANSNGVLLNAANLACVPSAPIELRSMERNDKLRSLEDELESAESKKDSSQFILQLTECWLKSCLWLTDRFVGQSSPSHLRNLDRLANLYLEQQRNDLAELTHLRALHIREQHFGKGQPELAVNLRGLATIYETRGNFQRAEEMYKEAIKLEESGLRKAFFLYSESVINEEKLGLQLESLFGTVADLAELYSVQNKSSHCAVVYEKALTLYEEIVERDPAVEATLLNYADKHIGFMQQLCPNRVLKNTRDGGIFSSYLREEGAWHE